MAQDAVEWRVWQSDLGRLWATRTKPFAIAAERDTYRTVDGDDMIGLCRSIAEQESAAALIAA